MNIVLRVLGISTEVRGYGIMEKMLYGKARHDNLTDREVKDVLEAWETRYIIPRKLLEEGYADRVSPAITEEEVLDGVYTQEEYEREYVRVINEYLFTIWV